MVHLHGNFKGSRESICCRMGIGQRLDCVHFGLQEGALCSVKAMCEDQRR